MYSAAPADAGAAAPDKPTGRRRSRSSAAHSGDDKAARAAAWRSIRASTNANTATIRRGARRPQPARRSNLMECCAVLGASLDGAIVRAARHVAHRQHEVGNTRSDLRAETRAVEHAVVSDARLQPVRLAI